MKKPKIVFRHFAGSGPLSIYWHDGPYGDAIEARKGRGVVWMVPHGELLGVEFDGVSWRTDEQHLELPSGDVVRLRVVRGKATVRLERSGRKSRRLERLLLDGLESGKAAPMTKKEWAELRKQVLGGREARTRRRADFLDGTARGLARSGAGHPSGCVGCG